MDVQAKTIINIVTIERENIWVIHFLLYYREDRFRKSKGRCICDLW